MRNKNYAFLLVFVTVFLLSLSAVSAVESANDTNAGYEDTMVEQTVKDTSVQNTVKDTDKAAIDSNNTNKIITKNTEKTDNTKEASKNLTSFDIHIRNNRVDNSTMEIGVIDYNSKKAVPYSVLNITLPNKSKINTKTLKSGYVNVTMNLSLGKNTIKIVYPGTSTHYSYDYDLEMDVYKHNTSLQVNVDESNITGDVKVNLTVLDATTGKALKNVKTQIKLSDGRNFTAKAGTNGIGTYDFKIKEGRTYLNVSYGGSTNYYSAKTSFYLDMGKVKKPLAYDVVFKSLYRGNTTVAVTVKDNETGKVIKNATIKIKVFNGATYSGKTNSKGVYTTKIVAPAGKNYMNLSFAGNSNYLAHTEKINFTVKKRVTNMSFTAKEDKLNISLKDLVFKKAVANVPVTLTLPNSTKVSLKTNKNGYVTYAIKPLEGTYKYTATFKGNENLTNITRSLKVNYKPKTLVTFNVTVTDKVYKQDRVVFTLIDAKSNKVIKNAPITIKLPSKTVQAKTNSNGKVVMQTNMSAGTNKVTLSYAGNGTYDARTATVNISLIKRPSVMHSMMYISDVFELDLNLSDAINGKPIANANVEVQHPKKTITFKTDSYGHISQTMVLPAGTADVKIVYKGNSIYSQSNVTYHNLTVYPSNKVTTKVSLNNVKGTLGEKVTLKAIVTDNKSNKITGGYVIFKLNGKPLKTDNTFNSNKATKQVAVKNGVATVTITADSNLQKSKNLTATFTGTSKYYQNTSAVTVAQIQNRRANLTVTATPKIQDQYGYVTFKANVYDTTTTKKKVPNNSASYVLFKINGVTLKNSKLEDIHVKVVNGTATFKYQIPKATVSRNSDNSFKSYTVTATYISPNYQTTSNKTVYNVKRSPVTFNITKIQFTKNTNTLVITGTIKDTKKNNVVGRTKLNLKVNGKYFKQSGKIAEYIINDGKISLKIKLATDTKKVNNVTLITKNNPTYSNKTYTVTKVSNV